MRDKYHQGSHTECCIDISIDRSEIIMPARWRKCENPVKTEAIEICAENIKKDPSDKPECLREWEIMTQEWLKKCFKMFHNEKT